VNRKILIIEDNDKNRRLIRDVVLYYGHEVIAMTSFPMTGDRERILDAGFDNYISSPIDTRELPASVKNRFRT
jgi:CheY-like chemotaxis protein